MFGEDGKSSISSSPIFGGGTVWECSVSRVRVAVEGERATISIGDGKVSAVMSVADLCSLRDVIGYVMAEWSAPQSA